MGRPDSIPCVRVGDDLTLCTFAFTSMSGSSEATNCVSSFACLSTISMPRSQNWLLMFHFVTGREGRRWYGFYHGIAVNDDYVELLLRLCPIVPLPLPGQTTSFWLPQCGLLRLSCLSLQSGGGSCLERLSQFNAHHGSVFRRPACDCPGAESLAYCSVPIRMASFRRIAAFLRAKGRRIVNKSGIGNTVDLACAPNAFGAIGTPWNCSKCIWSSRAQLMLNCGLAPVYWSTDRWLQFHFAPVSLTSAVE